MTPRAYTSVRVSNVQVEDVGLLRAHVVRRAQHVAGHGEAVLAGVLRRTRDAEVDDVRSWSVRLAGHQDVRGLQVAMDDAPLVCVLDARADGQEELQPLARGQPLRVRKGGDGCPADTLHHEVGTPVRRGAGVEHAGDSGMVEPGHRAPLRLETVQDARRAQVRRHQLDRDLASERLLLPRRVDDAHAPFAEDLVDGVGADLLRPLRLRLRERFRQADLDQVG